MQPLAWHHVCCRVPADWEITAYSVEDRAGRLELSSRRGFEAQLSWAPCRRQPDPRTTMATFLRRNVKHAPEVKNLRGDALRTQHAGPFLLGRGPAGPAQAIAWLPDSQRLLSWVFRQSGDEELHTHILPVLESFQPNHGPVRRYAVFGLDFCLPAEFEIEDMVTLPANVMLAYETKRRGRIICRRWGMPDVVLNGRAMREFYAGFLAAQGCDATRPQNTRLFNCPAVTSTYSRRGEYRMDRLMGKPWTGGLAWLWLHEQQQRLYSLEQIGPPGFHPLEPGTVFPRMGAPS